MIKERAWPAKAMYILIAAALAMSLIIMAAPVHNVSAANGEVVSEWDKVSTPSGVGAVLAPNSRIIDYALAEDGDTAYAIVEGTLLKEGTGVFGIWLLKSEDAAATWSDLNDALDKVNKSKKITGLLRVATDGMNPDFVAVALTLNVTTSSNVSVYFSTDGGGNFNDAGEVVDVVYFRSPADVSDLAVSLEGADAKRNIAISGQAWDNTVPGYAAGLFRCTVGGDVASRWEDATYVTNYPGWDDQGEPATAFNSILITDIMFSPSWPTDSTILATTVTDTSPYTVHLQSGTWGRTHGSWNKKAGFVNAVPVLVNKCLPMPPVLDVRAVAGITLPSDYSGAGIDTRYVWVWVNYYDSCPSSAPTGEIFRIKNGLRTSVEQQIETMPWLTNVSYQGTIAGGKAIAGILGNGAGDNATCCEGVQVYHKDEIEYMDICCPAWEDSCKPPTGRFYMSVSYVSEEKAYAVALQDGAAYDEGAWSVSVDGDGLIWNQLSLIDTNIDYLSDVAVSPDCNKTMLVSVSKVTISYSDCPTGTGCDSVWLHADVNLPEAPEYTGKWVRTWCGRLTSSSYNDLNCGWQYSDKFPERGLLRLAPEEDDGMTVYLVDRMTSTIYYNDMETWNCWETKDAGTQIDRIADLAVKDAATIYALDHDGDVSMSDDHGAAISWTDAVEGEVTNGWTIAVRNSDVLVGGREGEVSYSDDGGETFTKLEETAKIDGFVSVAFDGYFDQNNTIYAATACGDKPGIYRWVWGTSDEWKDIGAIHYDYTGLTMGRNPGNPMTSADTGSVLYASYIGETCNSDWSTADDFTGCWDNLNEHHCWVTGVARCLTPAADISCDKCIEWDYLTVGLTDVTEAPHYGEMFIMAPQPLKTCGCLDETTNTKLFAIGLDVGYYDEIPVPYDMTKAKWSTVWTFEDCYAKKAPTITEPADGAIIPADCDCNNLPFSLKWDAVCDACYYDVQIALDDQFTDVVWQSMWEDIFSTGTWYYEGGKEVLGASGLGVVIPSILVCDVTYYWRVRAHQAGTCQIIHSWWSDAATGATTLTIAPPAAQSAITLVAPVPGATGLGTKNTGFSWNLQAKASSFDWVLSPNADLSSPLDSKDGLTNKAYTYTGTLEHGTTYYWQVTAYNNGAPISTSAIGTFTTGPTGPFCSAIDGRCFETEAELIAHNDDLVQEAPTPFWVWVVIVIGAVLVIVVIVLIFRTRRV